MAVRKRCKHAAGKTGSAKTRAWRQCTCAWGADIYVDGVRTWKNLGHDEQAARIADAQLRLDVMQGKRVRRSVGTGFSDLAEDWYAEKAADPDARPGSLIVYRTRINHAKRYLGDIPIGDIRQHHVNSLVESFTRDIGAPTATNVAGVVGAIITWAFRNFRTRGVVEGVSLRDSAARVGHGANYAQSLAYGWASEQVDATAVDAAIERHD